MTMLIALGVDRDGHVTSASSRGASEASEHGIHNRRLWLWIPDLALRAIPE
jgi:hypothetical protein